VTLTSKSVKSSLSIVWPIVIVGGCIGFFLSWLVLSGDQQGRVNIFYLLLVYLLIPLLSVIASLVSLFLGKGINLARLLSMLPIWTFQSRNLIRKIQQLNLDKYWFLMQSQAAAIAFSLASLITFFILLLVTDLNFVWRSTIIQPNDLLPILETVASPWSFWSAAQPDLALLEMTQDSRLTNTSGVFTGYGAWWKFILATQLCYSLLTRILLIIWTRWWLKSTAKADIEKSLQRQIHQHNPNPEEKIESSSLIHQLPETLMINNWDQIPPQILAMLPQLDLSDNKLITNNWQTNNINHSEQLVIVKAWEGPLGELEDYLQQGHGYLLPLDWKGYSLVKPQ